MKPTEVMNPETENESLDSILAVSSTLVNHSSPSSAEDPTEDDWEEECTPSTPPDPPLVDSEDIRHVHTRWLKPHPFSVEVYGGELADEDLVESIKRIGVRTPLQVTVDGVVISGHRRLWAARKAGLKTLPVFVGRPRNCVGSEEEQILEANRNREKNNEQKIREFIGYKRIESARAKERNGYRWDLVPDSAPGDAEPKPGVYPHPLVTLNREVGKARDLAAARVGMAGSTAADGEKVIAVLDRLWAAENYRGYGQLQEALLKSIHAATQLGLQRGWIPKSSKKLIGKHRPLVTDSSGEDTHKEPTPDSEGSCEPVVDQASPTAVAETVDPARSGETAPSHDPVAKPPTADSHLYTDKRMPDEEKRKEQVPGVAAVASSAEGTSVTPSTTIPLSEDPVWTPPSDPVEADAESGEPVGDLIPADKVSQILAAVTRRDFPGSTDPDILECSRRFVGSVAALLNEQAREFPDMEGHDLCRALGIANTKIQVAMKWL